MDCLTQHRYLCRVCGSCTQSFVFRAADRSSWKLSRWRCRRHFWSATRLSAWLTVQNMVKLKLAEIILAGQTLEFGIMVPVVFMLQ